MENYQDITQHIGKNISIQCMSSKIGTDKLPLTESDDLQALKSSMVVSKVDDK